MEEAKKRRSVHKGAMTRAVKAIEAAIAAGSPMEYVDVLSADLKEAWGRVQTGHEAVLMAGNPEDETQESWISDLEDTYNRVRLAVIQHKADSNTQTNPPQPGSSRPSLQLKKMDIPKFEGDVKEYYRFKTDFTKFIVPLTNADQVAFALRQSLGPEPRRILGPIEDNATEMWKRLDERYGDRIKLVDTIIQDLERQREIKEGENRKLVTFIDMVESSYHNLKGAGLEREMSNSKVVGDVEKKLPPAVFGRWARFMCDEGNGVDKTDRLPQLLSFLVKERRSVEYTMEAIRTTSSSRAVVHAVDVMDNMSCVLHPTAQHTTETCRQYLAKGAEQRMNAIREGKACFCCLGVGHILSKCRKKKQCGTDGCTRLHHPTLHRQGPPERGSATSTPSAGVPEVFAVQNSMNGKADPCLLQLMEVQGRRDKLITLWDSCATSSLITHSAARRNGVRGSPVRVHITKVGDITEPIDTFKYRVPLTDMQGNVVTIEAYGIERITARVGDRDLDHLAKLFDVNADAVRRPSGDVDLLIGFEYAAYHPVKVQSRGHLLLLRNQFGQCLGGSHPSIEPEESMELHIHHVKASAADEFLTIESMGVSCEPRCGSCRCGKCPLGAKNLTLKEERELNMIENNMKHVDGRWIAQYPWVKDPRDLPDNRPVAIATLKGLEKRLQRCPEKAAAYNSQMEDMLQRGVAREVTDEEMQEYSGPVHYISHHAVEKPDSESTPVRIVFNSSANYKGHVLNGYWAKGPDLLNSLLAVLLRFREEHHALVGDVRKMFHSVGVSLQDQHCHRFLWRAMDTSQPPKTYCVTAVNFGDRPSATIATVALRKTAQMGTSRFPEAAETIMTNVYMDDILECVPSRQEAKSRADQIEKLLAVGNFAIKKWAFSGKDSVNDSWEAKDEKVLGISWKSQEDRLTFKGNAQTFQCVPEVLTKRICLSKVNSVYDPLGLLTPVTVRAKILLRQLWGAKLDWDQALSSTARADWVGLFEDLGAASQLEFKRCVKPVDTREDGKPVLVMFSDASEQAMGTAAYARFELADGKFGSQLIASKSRVAPVEVVSIVRLELSAAVMSKRLASYILKESRIDFARVYYLVDSQIVRAMIQKESYGFNTFAATRIGEIQQGTNPQDWWWCAGEINVADFITRGKSPSSVGLGSTWQEGPGFLGEPFDEWPVSQSCTKGSLPETAKVVMLEDVVQVDDLASRIDITRFSECSKLLRVTARILSLSGNRSLGCVRDEPTAESIKKAEAFWVKEAQRPMKALLENDRGKFDRLYGRLGPKLRDDGIIVVGDRVKDHVHFSYDKEVVPLLPYDHPFCRLFAAQVHGRGHLGVQATASKIRSLYWIIGVCRMVKSIRYQCVTCRRFDRNVGEQQMAPLPVERLKPAPPWTYVGVDLFGPFVTRGEVNKRARGKAYGVVFDCLLTRAVYVDVASDYSTDAFLQVLRRFVSLRGYPKEIYSDSGTQLSAAAKELNGTGVMEGLTWKFSTPDAPWQNGVTESLIRGIKKSLCHVVGEQVMTFSELQTVLFEVANIVNERPIGRHPTEPDDGSYLSPNMILLGRSSGKVPDGPFQDKVNPKGRLKFIQSLVNAFWKKWTQSYFPSLIVRQRWHTTRRNLQVDDVVLVQDSNVVRGNWRIGRVVEVYPDAGGLVRNVKVKVASENGMVTSVKRAVQRLVVILPVEEQ